MAENLPMQKVVGAKEVRNKLGAFLNRVHRGEEHLVIEKLGIPVAALISMKDYEDYRRLLILRKHHELGRKLGAEAERQGITEEKLFDRSEEARQAVYEEMYGQKP